MTDEAPAMRREAWRFGPLGFRERIEPVIRAIVAERFGVPAHDLLPEVSFADDLGAMPADVTELVVDVERIVGVHVPEAAIDHVQTYADLVDAVADARAAMHPAAAPRLLLRTVLVPGGRSRRGIVVRSAWSTPYALRTITEEARRAGRGACLVATLPGDATGPDVDRVEHLLGGLRRHGVTVRVHREEEAAGRAVA